MLSVYQSFLNTMKVPANMLETPTAATVALLHEQLPGAAEAAAAQPNRVVRIEAPAAPVAPLAWLAAQKGVGRYYWADRSGALVMAGLGEADILAPPAPVADVAGPLRCIRCRLADAPRGARYYGGFRFHLATPRTAPWRDFTAFRFVLPRVEYVQRAGGAVLAVNLLARHADDAAAEADAARARLEHLQLGGDEQAPAPLPRIVAREDRPGRAQWGDLVRSALAEMERGALRKVVLARETTLRAAADIDPVALLRELDQWTLSTYNFCFAPEAGRAFIGASPERLFHRNNVYLRTEAIAGTRRRGGSDAEDARLGRELLEGEKERREHAFVADMLHERLESLARAVRVREGPKLLQLRNVQHLVTKIEALLPNALPEWDARLVAALHPTPAVGGEPRAAALDWLSAHEPFDRGIYAAPVGWINADGAEFCVGIRSALVRGEALRLYTGAGIVPGSDPDAEWDEIESKLSGYLGVLQGRVRHGAQP